MKAARIHEFGGPEAIKIEEVDQPQVGDGKVLVKVVAASLNPFDTTVRSGRVAGMVTLPVTLGGDIAGTVVEASDGVTTVSVGDEVFGQAAAVAGNSGALAEFAVTKANQVAQKPDSIDYIAAASLPLVGVSALQALGEHINLQPGQTILIQGGAGAIGSLAIQVAKNIGATVIATASGDGVAFAEQMGADRVIDYTMTKFDEVVDKVEAVFDTVGGQTLERSYAVVKPGGILVTMIGQVNEEKAKQLGIRVVAQQTRVTTERLEQLAELVDDGVIKPTVAQTFPLDQVAEAFQFREAGHVIGKVVVKIAE